MVARVTLDHLVQVRVLTGQLNLIACIRSPLRPCGNQGVFGFQGPVLRIITRHRGRLLRQNSR